MESDPINQPGKKDDVTGEGYPGEHLAVDFFQPILVQRPNDDEIGGEQEQQPSEWQLVHLLAVNHSTENAIAAGASAHVSAAITGLLLVEHGDGNSGKAHPKPRAAIPG